MGNKLTAAAALWAEERLRKKQNAAGL